ncbi:uncharacterized protein NPIL_292651 [Nephila pilipes]|uniref:Uncharacterized protein n=1 Tax=Nephila pilipes TaxID=299642 RepID=A0A8X6MDW3_NEPPI|nr:uncharacterized protein NPIL_292651 [Nephila pilipes]
MDASEMSSEHDEGGESQGVRSDNEKNDPPVLKDESEHAKPRRRCRRGKKRKQRKDSGAICENEAIDEHEAGHSNTWGSDEELDCEINAYNDVIVRPINVPKAPENSTQFIIDDHNECRLYMSFETPNPYVTNAESIKGEAHVITEPAEEDAAFIDIDYEYESPQDFDNTAYYDRDFEQSYKNNRFDELLRLPKSDLISGIQNLESKLKTLSEDLVKENPSPILEKLQAELLELQEKHLELKECNSRLTALVMQSETVTEESPANPLSGELSPKQELASPITKSKGGAQSMEDNDKMDIPDSWSKAVKLLNADTNSDLENSTEHKLGVDQTVLGSEGTINLEHGS